MVQTLSYENLPIIVIITVCEMYLYWLTVKIHDFYKWLED